MDHYALQYLDESIEVIRAIDAGEIEKAVAALVSVRESNGRVFTVGLGGSHATASHLACDIHKLDRIDACCLGDNVSELLAGVNDGDGEDFFQSMMRRRSIDTPGTLRGEDPVAIRTSRVA